MSRGRGVDADAHPRHGRMVAFVSGGVSARSKRNAVPVRCSAKGDPVPVISIPQMRNSVATVEFYVDKASGEEYVEWWIDDMTDKLSLGVFVLSTLGALLSAVTVFKAAMELNKSIGEKNEEDRYAQEQEAKNKEGLSGRSEVAQQLRILSSQRDDLRDEVVVIQRRLDYVNIEIRKSKDELARVQAQLKKVVEETLSRQLKEETAQQKLQRKECAALAEKLRGLEMEKDEVESQLRSCTADMSSVRRECDILEGEISALMVTSKELLLAQQVELVKRLKEEQKLAGTIAKRLREERKNVQLKMNVPAAEIVEPGPTFATDLSMLEQRIAEAKVEVEKLRKELNI